MIVGRFAIHNAKLVGHCFNGLNGVENLDSSPNDHRGVGVAFMENTKLFKMIDRGCNTEEVDPEIYFRNIEDGIWIWANKNEDNASQLDKLLSPTTKVFYMLPGEKRFDYNNEVDLDDVDAILDDNKEYRVICRIDIHERQHYCYASDRYYAYLNSIIIKEKD